MASPIVLSPALPSELLSCIVAYCVHPTTLIVCSSRADFLSSLINDIHRSSGHEDPLFDDLPPGEEQTKQDGPSTPTVAARRLLQAPLYQVAIARHIRMVFVPTVSHLRALLAVFSREDSAVPEPPPPPPPPARPVPSLLGSGSEKRRPLLVVYGFLELHRHTSEWSAQGLGGTAAMLVEAARREAFRAVVVDSRGGRGREAAPREVVPVLSGSARREGPDAEDGGWRGRTVEVRRVLGRWFRFLDAAWETGEVSFQ